MGSIIYIRRPWNIWLSWESDIMVEINNQTFIPVISKWNFFLSYFKLYILIGILIIFTYNIIILYLSIIYHFQNIYFIYEAVIIIAILFTSSINSLFFGILYHYPKWIRSNYRIKITENNLIIKYWVYLRATEIIPVVDIIPIKYIKNISRYNDIDYKIRMKKLLFPLIHEINNIIHHPYASKRDIVFIELTKPLSLRNFFITPVIGKKISKKIIMENIYININSSEIEILLKKCNMDK